MRRLLTLCTAMMLVVSTGAGITNADTSGGCSGPGQCRTSGLGMQAAWSGVPIGGPELGVVYTDTFISGWTTSTGSRGTRTATAGAMFDQVSYRYDDLASKPTLLGESYTVDVGPGFVVTVDRGLGTASVSGIVMMASCTIDANYAETCGDPAPTTVSGTWTATGARLQVVSTYHAKGPGFTMNSTFHGWDRQASVVATIGGNAVAGAIEFGDIFDSQSNSVSLCRAPAC